MYKVIKSIIDRVLALIGLVILAPLFLILIIAIKLDSRGPVLFKQKRVGIHKKYFYILKFRTMRIDTPKDTPTHLLKNPEQYITKVGGFLRKTSLDELPQIINILGGDMAIVGPRPALWNQYDLIAERDKYGANDILPGLTGWAQINGRDELKICEKARLDGEYKRAVEKSSISGFIMDCRCFFGTIISVISSKGVVEGGTGKIDAIASANKKLKIWVFVDYNMLPEHGTLNRHYNLGKAMTERGHDVVVFAGSHPHNTNLQLIEGNEKFVEYQKEPFPWVLVKTLNYGNSKIRRVLSMYVYYRNAKVAARIYGKPDVIIGSSAHPLCAVLANKLAKKYYAKSIVEIRDLWPESIVAMGVAKVNNPLIKVLYSMERKIYEKADAIIFTFEGGYNYIEMKGWTKTISKDKVFYINNGIFVNEFDEYAKKYTLNDTDLDSGKFIVMYTGAVKLANGLDKLVECAKKVQEYKDILFLVYGDGDYKAELIKKCKEEHINNVKFKGNVEKKYIPYILSKSSLNLLNYNTTAATAGLYRFGSSQNKIFDYFASGKPIISNTKINYDLIEKYKCGISKKLWDADEYVEELLKIYNLSEDEYRALCMNARNAAYDFDFATHAKTLEEICHSLIK